MGRECNTSCGEDECIWDSGGTARRNETIRARPMRDIKMDVIGIKWGGMDWIDLAQGTDQWKESICAPSRTKIYNNNSISMKLPTSFKF
jgi:hypothetical protein